MYSATAIQRNITPVLLVLFAVCLSIFYSASPSFGYKIFSTPSKSDISATQNNTLGDSDGASVFAELAKPIYGAPVRIYATGIDAKIEEIGLTDSGQLGVPNNPLNAGWYSRSALVGARGNVIIDGHYDSIGGKPAAFWNLKNLKINDKVFLIDDYNRETVYTITAIHYVDIQDSDRIEKLTSSVGKTLTLVTCNGVWVPSEGTYNKRLIIKAEAKGL
ncbi:MAG: class F sortase [Patescibacteria group bacterium]|uniref:Class F sortase n=1 Tax=candidate division WWE3 bacterium TaxID=2053526 RepID=A0A955EBZ0_UNCKA|nr:class F sortase [candidate division WWE3 bacterium]